MFSSQQRDNKPCPTTKPKIGLSGDVTNKLFPYHVMIDQSFTTIQVGTALAPVLNMREEDLVGNHIGDVFSIRSEVGNAWTWDCLQLLEEEAFELTTNNHLLSFKTTLVPLSSDRVRATDNANQSAVALLILTPQVQTLQELHDHNLTLQDLPLHGAHRDALFLSEHLSFQLNNSLRVEKLTRHLNREKGLLETLLPVHAAEGLRKGKVIPPKLHKHVTFFFSDIVGFTAICNQLEPWQVIEMLNQLYTVMDYLAAKFHLFKVETIGDAYVCCSGLPYADPDHAQKVANFALAVNRCAQQVLSPVDGTPIQLRIGVHTGPSASGVVGVTNPRYCVFGDTVNATARHESSGHAGQVHCSQQVQALLQSNKYKEAFRLVPRKGRVEMKGLGSRQTYWLQVGERNESLHPAALAKLDQEVQDLLAQADFQTTGSNNPEDETALHYSSDSPEDATTTANHNVCNMQEFKLPRKTSVVRNSAPSMHDFRRIGSLMKKIREGKGTAKQNFSWEPQNQDNTNKKPILRRAISLGAPPSSSSKLSIHSIVERLPKRLNDTTQQCIKGIMAERLTTERLSKASPSEGNSCQQGRGSEEQQPSSPKRRKLRHASPKTAFATNNSGSTWKKKPQLGRQGIAACLKEANLRSGKRSPLGFMFLGRPTRQPLVEAAKQQQEECSALNR